VAPSAVGSSVGCAPDRPRQRRCACGNKARACLEEGAHEAESTSGIQLIQPGEPAEATRVFNLLAEGGEIRYSLRMEVLCCW